MNQPRATFWDRVQRYPPIVCRLLARHPHGPPLTDQEIAERGHLSSYAVFVLGSLLTWDDVTMGHMRRFLKGCNLDFENPKHMKRIESYLRALKSGKIDRTFAYLERSPDYESVYLPLRITYEEHVRATRS